MTMEFDSVSQFFHDRTILITGATGFLAKVLLEKILRTQPNVRKVYLLIRATDEESSLQRLHHEIINTELFRILRVSLGSHFDHFTASKLMPISGDISCEHLGIKDPYFRESLWKEVEVVMNVAATVNFDERMIDVVIKELVEKKAHGVRLGVYGFPLPKEPLELVNGVRLDVMF